MQQYLVNYMFDATIWGVTLIGDEEWLMKVMRSDAKGDGDLILEVGHTFMFGARKLINLHAWCCNI